MATIVHQRWNQLEIIQHFKSKVTFSSSIEADIIFSTCNPSLAIIFLDLAVKDIEEHIYRIERIQSSFKHSLALFVGILSQHDWQQIQNKVGFGSTRLFLVGNIQEAMKNVCIIRNHLEQKEKQTNQQAYFKNLRISAESRDTARIILQDALMEMQIPEEEITIILEGCPSTQALITASKQALEDNLPISIATITKLYAVFGPSAPYP